MADDVVAVAEAPRSNRIRGTVIAAASLYVFDAFLFNQGFWVVPGAVAMLVVGLLTRSTAQARLVKIALTLALPFAVWGTNHLQNVLARARAETVIAAVEHYRADRGAFPARLDDLVPAYLPSVPRAKYTLMGSFYYHGDSSPFLMYAELPPFGRPVYSFSTRSWGYLD